MSENIVRDGSFIIRWRIHNRMIIICENKGWNNTFRIEVIIILLIIIFISTNCSVWLLLQLDKISTNSIPWINFKLLTQTRESFRIDHSSFFILRLCCSIKQISSCTIKPNFFHSFNNIWWIKSKNFKNIFFY